jgi:hypothetical protein
MKAPVFFAVVLALAACNQRPAGDNKALNCAAQESGALKVENAWVRAQSDATGMSAAYFTLCNASEAPVTIEGLSTPAAGIVEFHETKKDAKGIVTMAPTGPITLAAGERIVFEPGGRHAMLMSLTGPIVEGSATKLTLQLAGGESVSADAIAVSAVEAAGHAH